MTATCDLLVIGAGPAGMAAATLACELGLDTVLVEQQSSPGGQIYRAAERSPHPLADALGPDYARGAELVAALRASGADLRFGQAVVDIGADGWVGLADERDAVSYIRARRILVATGAMERPFPVPGWTLPGVMTAGAAQILLKEDLLLPQDAVLIGTGPLPLLLAGQLAAAGRPLKAFLDTTPRANIPVALRHLPRALRSHRRLIKGVGMAMALRRSATRHVSDVTDLGIEGDDRARAVSWRSGGREHRLEASLFLLHQGVVPNTQITRALRCEHEWDGAQLCWRPVTNAWGRTSLDAVYCAGDGSGIGGATASEQGGRLAALSAAQDLGAITAAQRDRRARPISAAQRRELALRPFLDALYRPADALRVPAIASTIVCRCEEVTAGEISRAIEAGASGPNQLKAFLRAGMGACQGRMCGLTVCETIAAKRGVSPAEVGYYRIRMPVRPVPLGSYARMELPAEATAGQPMAKITGG